MTSQKPPLPNLPKKPTPEQAARFCAAYATLGSELARYAPDGAEGYALNQALYVGAVGAHVADQALAVLAEHDPQAARLLAQEVADLVGSYWSAPDTLPKRTRKAATGRRIAVERLRRRARQVADRLWGREEVAA